MLNLEGMNTDLNFVVVNIDQDLGYFPYPGYRLEGMTITQDGEIGDCIQFKKVRAGYEKKIADHQVGCPLIKQV